MTSPLFEAVPNFSEGRDPAKISRIAHPVRAVPSVRVLGLHSDPDHNRSVLTFAGAGDAVLKAAVALAESCCAEIDLASQTGEHPRMGSLDVLPFVPLEGATLEDAASLARQAGERLGKLGLPVYLYEAAATAPHRRNLANIRRGGYAGLAGRMGDPLWQPDYGPAELDPRRGAVAVGARPFLIAFNAYLDTDDVEVARAVARRVRERDGGLPGLKALGLPVGGKAQVSMNLTNLEKTPMPTALEAVRAAAAELGASVESTELVGLAPLEAILEVARYYLRLRELEEEHIIEAALWDAPES
ncbi:MAG: glutamate formimidoyltransferase [Rubrobacter sp.]|nr:glutamate formimidoyltransferase [Rubrobacteraceae bacterium]MBD0356088.1 glutamate formimidoyltransferase [Rubrobacter sp.]